ncbi:MAG: pyruvate kinase [Patescibacteria group bacterium]|nr:pyruvate kinase [Patescibacteria group bacterium]
MDIIATIWKEPYYHDRNQRMIDAGVDCFRLKCSHWGVDKIANSLLQARMHIDASGRPIKLLADMPEAKIRLGDIPGKRVNVTAGESFTFKTAESTSDVHEFVPLQLQNLDKHFKAGDVFYTGDGQLSLRVIEVQGSDRLVAVTQNDGRFILKTGVTIPGISDGLNHITPALDGILALLPESQPDYVAFSFINSRSMLETLNQKLARYTTRKWQPKIIAKIESRKGVENIDEIVDFADGIMVARGDLALTMPFAELGVTQKYLVRKAREAGKYVIVATQVLFSLLDNYIPNRSDILDVTNTCLDGASAIMLCAETAHNEHPERAVSVARDIIRAVEASQNK